MFNVIKCNDNQLRFNISVKHIIGKHELAYALYHNYYDESIEYPLTRTAIINITRKLIEQNVNVFGPIDQNNLYESEVWNDCIEHIEQVFPELNK